MNPRFGFLTGSREWRQRERVLGLMISKKNPFES
jgi:hypothetical protein